MKRAQILLAVAGAILIVVVFFVVLFQPARTELAEIEDQIAAEEGVQTQLRQEIARLRDVRERAPEVEAELAMSEAIVPREPALPLALRQLQAAADESGIVLSAVTTARPAQVPDAPEELQSISVNVQLEGGYFPIVDFLRRIEDPAITVRGVLWNQANVTVEEYPTLLVSLSGQLFANIERPIPPVTEDATPEAGENGDDGEIDETGETGDPADPADDTEVVS